MVMIKGCCCFRSLKTATVAGGMFTLVTSLIQILITVAVFTTYAEMWPDFLKTLTDRTMEPRQLNIAIMYIVLAAASFLVVVDSLKLLYGVDAKKQSPRWFYAWLVVVPIYVLYESAINIYYFYWIFTLRPSTDMPPSIFNPMSTALGFSIVPLVYCAIKEIVIIIFWVVVFFHAREVKALKAAGAQPAVADDPFRGVQLGPGGISSGPGPIHVINRSQPVGIYAAAPPPAAFQPATYDRPYCVQRGGGYGPSGPYRMY